MGMDGLNNAVIPGYATPEQYTKEITIANDGIVDQKAVYKYAQRCYAIIEELDSFGIRFLKNENGDFAVKKVHHIGTYVLPMPNGETVKKALYRQLRRARLLISNRYMATRLLTGTDGRVAGAIAVNTRTAEFLVIKAKAVILCMGAAGRLGLPTSGYLFGTYENAANSGDGYAMAYHAGAELANLECFQINPLIKDYNGPACAYVAGPFGAYTANNEGERFIECDYWSGQMMLEFYQRAAVGQGPGVPQAQPPARGDDRRDRDASCTRSSGRPAACSTRAAAPTTAARWSRCTSPRSASAPATARRACSSTSSRAPPCRACTRPATWRACRTTTCSAPSPTARSPARTRSSFAGERRLRRLRRRPTSRARRSACWRRPGARTAFRRTRSSTRRAASSTTTCSRPR